jgi:hypothetical protein
MANRFLPANFTERIELGKANHIRNPNTGASDLTFVKELGPFLCAPYVRTMHQNFQLLGTEFSDTRQVAVWHNPSVTTSLQFAKIGSQIYDLVQVSPDQTGSPNKVDILTLKPNDSVEVSSDG